MLCLWSEMIIYFFYEVIEFTKIKSNYGYILNLKTIFLGTLIVIKNLLYFLLNFIMILISKKIFNSMIKNYKFKTMLNTFK